MPNHVNTVKPAICPNLPQIAVEHGRQGHGCSQAILAAFGPYFGLPEKIAVKIATGFAGGMGLGETCGAVTASFMVLGLAFGTDNVQDVYSRQHAYAMVGEFADRFKSKIGSLNCRDLSTGFSAGYDIYTPEGARALRASGRPEQIVEQAAAILFSLLNEEHIL
jgi:C_GCAxxG_C_C family probable redox protein